MIKVGDLVRMKKRRGVKASKKHRNLGLVLKMGLKSRSVVDCEPSSEAAKIQWTNGVTTVTGISMVEQAHRESKKNFK